MGYMLRPHVIIIIWPHVYGVPILLCGGVDFNFNLAIPICVLTALKFEMILVCYKLRVILAGDNPNSDTYTYIDGWDLRITCCILLYMYI